MGNTCSCVKRQQPSEQSGDSEDVTGNHADGTYQPARTESSAGTVPAAPGQIVVVTRNGSRIHLSGNRLVSANHDVSSHTGAKPDIPALILDTLKLIRSLTANDDQDPPWSLVQLHKIAEDENGWVLVIYTLLTVIPLDNPLGPATISLLIDDCSLPTKETLDKLLKRLQFSSKGSRHDVLKHRNICIALGCLAEKMSGPGSQWLLSTEVLDYLFSNLEWSCDKSIILFSIIALEKFALTSENQLRITAKFKEQQRLNALGTEWNNREDFIKREVSFCARWCLDNIFVLDGHQYAYETVDMSNINAMLNSHDVSEYLKLSPEGLEARCDALSFESVRCTYQVGDSGVWYYEVLIVTAGIMQIGWATKDSKFLNYEGFGIGDDENSIAYDGCRQLIWFNANSSKHRHTTWKPGDVLGLLLDLDKKEVVFSLNGDCLPPNGEVFAYATAGFFAAASFMSYQQCCFNFGASPFVYPPGCKFNSFNDFGQLSDKVILPRKIKLARLREIPVQENSCSLCADNVANVQLLPCKHEGFCMQCAVQLQVCPLCRTAIGSRQQRYSSLVSSTSSS